MHRLAPSVQSETEGLESMVEKTTAASTGTPADRPFLDGPAPALWAGFGAFILIFVLGMMLIIRGRVVNAKPRRQKKNVQSASYFEPAGEDAEISFDEDDAPAITAKPARWTDDADAEITIDPAPAHDKDHTAGPAVEHDAQLAAAPAKQKKSSFAGLFARKPSDDTTLAKKEGYELGDMDDGFFPPEPERPTHDSDDDGTTAHPLETAPRETTMRETTAREPHSAPLSAYNEQRIAEAEDTAREALQRAADAEALARDLKRANREAESIINLSLREKEAALEERASALRVMEKRLSSLSDEYQSRLATAPLALAATPTADHHGNVSEAHFAEFADLMGEQFDTLRSTVSSALERLSARLDQLPAATPQPAGALPLSPGALTAARVQLGDLLSDVLPPQRFTFGRKLSSGRTADACITMPGAMSPIAIDAKFPVESFDAWRAGRGIDGENALRREVLRHIADAAERLIIPGETADCAMMFIPSEHILSELHAHFSDLIQESYRARVWMVAPTSLMATLHTISAVMHARPAHEPQFAPQPQRRENGAQTPPPSLTPPPAPNAQHTMPSTGPAQYGSLFEGGSLHTDAKHDGAKESDAKPPFPLR